MSAPCPIFGFELTFRLRSESSENDRIALWDAFVEQVEARGLCAAGGGDIVWRHVIERDGGQAIDADRQALLAWAESQEQIVDAQAGPLIDLTEG
jgi:uncharacterized protein YggL (DUF469 family)